VKDQSVYWRNYLGGDNEVLTKLYVNLFEPLVMKAIYYTKNPEVARDIVSALFVYLLELPKEERMRRWEGHSNFEFLLLCIVRNKCLDHLKIEQNRNRIQQQLETELETNTNDDLITQLTTCIQQLKPKEKELIELHLQGYKNEEISEKLNLSEKTVRNKLSLSRQLIVKFWHQMVVILMTLLWN